MAQSLVQFWNKYQEADAPYCHPADKAVLFAPKKNDVLTDAVKCFPEYLTDAHFARRGSHRVDLSLVPVPYAGDLSKADIVILLLNPGLSYTDYYGDLGQLNYREARYKNLRQDFSDTSYPFLWLNPDFCWHSGFMWWEEKLRPILRLLAEQKYKSSYLKALQALSRRVCMVELVPYHSSNTPSGRLIRELPSATAARQYVQQVVVPEAQTGKKLLIVTRQAKIWGITQNANNIVVYDRHEARGASMSPNSPGGAAILRRLVIK